MNSATSEIPIATIEASHGEREGVIEEILNTILPINKAPLMRLFVIKHPEDITTLAIHLSHTIADGFSSMRIMGNLPDILDKSRGKNLPELREKRKSRLRLRKKTQRAMRFQKNLDSVWTEKITSRRIRIISVEP